MYWYFYFTSEANACSFLGLLLLSSLNGGDRISARPGKRKRSSVRRLATPGKGMVVVVVINTMDESAPSASGNYRPYFYVPAFDVTIRLKSQRSQ